MEESGVTADGGITSLSVDARAAAAAAVPEGRPHPARPKRPFTEYNVFFQLERELLLQSNHNNGNNNKNAHNTIDDNEGGYTPTKILSKGKQIDPHASSRPPQYRHLILPHDWYVVGSKYASQQSNLTHRKHRKMHGLISFVELTKYVSARWKEVCRSDPVTKEYCAKIAQGELMRYRKEMEAFVNMYGVEAAKGKKRRPRGEEKKKTKELKEDELRKQQEQGREQVEPKLSPAQDDNVHVDDPFGKIKTVDSFEDSFSCSSQPQPHEQPSQLPSVSEHKFYQCSCMKRASFNIVSNQDDFPQHNAAPRWDNMVVGTNIINDGMESIMNGNMNMNSNINLNLICEMNSNANIYMMDGMKANNVIVSMHDNNMNFNGITGVYANTTMNVINKVSVNSNTMSNMMNDSSNSTVVGNFNPMMSSYSLHTVMNTNNPTTTAVAVVTSHKGPENKLTIQNYPYNDVMTNTTAIASAVDANGKKVSAQKQNRGGTTDENESSNNNDSRTYNQSK